MKKVVLELTPEKKKEFDRIFRFIELRDADIQYDLFDANKKVPNIIYHEKHI